MLSGIHPKYTMSVHPKAGTTYNPLHDEVDGATATIIDLAVGERGWLAYCFAPDDWHRIHTSTGEDVVVDEYGNVMVATNNTIYRLAKWHSDNN